MDLISLKIKAIDVREGALKLVHQSSGHIGGTLSSADILTAIYYKYLRYNPNCPDDPTRDRFVLSKGHTCEGYLWVLADCGFFDPSELDTFNTFGSKYLEHPNSEINGVEFSTGSLGHGLALSCGLALAGKKQNIPYDCYVLMGDGETNEGSVWEAAMFASANHLDNLYVIVDRNHLQISGPTEDVMPLEPYADKWKAFGFDTVEIDGNDMEQILKAFDVLHEKTGKPKIIISNTTKGKGVSFMEGKKEWHHGHPTDEQYLAAIDELEKLRRELKENA